MEFLEGLNWGLLAPLFIIQLILLIVSLVDLSRIEKTNGPKLLWVFVIIFVRFQSLAPQWVIRTRAALTRLARGDASAVTLRRHDIDGRTARGNTQAAALQSKPAERPAGLTAACPPPSSPR